MGEAVPRIVKGWMEIATMPVGTFWTRGADAPLDECCQEAARLNETQPVGCQWWMPFKRAIN